MKQISELQVIARPVMEALFMMLWPGEDLPDNFFDLAVRLQEAPLRIAEWKSSAAWEGACQAWTTLKAHYPSLNLGPIISANPKGPDGNYVSLESFFDAVMEFARATEDDYHQKDFIE